MPVKTPAPAKKTSPSLSSIGADLSGLPRDSSDETTKKEEAVFGFADAERMETVKRTVHNIFIAALYVAAFFLLLLVLARVSHLILPANNATNAKAWNGFMPHCWLSKEQLTDVDRFLNGGLIGAVLAYFGKHLGVSIKTKDKP